MNHNHNPERDQFDRFMEIIEGNVDALSKMDLKPDPLNMQKMIDVYELLESIINDDPDGNGPLEGELLPVEVEKELGYAVLSAIFPTLDLVGCKFLQMQTIMSMVDSMSVDTTMNGGVCVSFSVNDVFVLKGR